MSVERHRRLCWRVTPRLEDLVVTQNSLRVGQKRSRPDFTAPVSSVCLIEQNLEGPLAIGAEVFGYCVQ